LKTRQSLCSWRHALKVLKGVRTNCSFRYLPDGLPGLRGPAIPIANKIVLRTVPRTGQLIGYFEVLGALRIGGLIAEGDRLNQVLEHIYVADVFRKADRSAEFSIDAETFDQTNWLTIGLGLADDPQAIVAHLLEAQEPLKALWQKREAELVGGEAGRARGEAVAAKRATSPCLFQRVLAALCWVRPRPRRTID
jgi:hypothetical protein